jgi:hypothetical protein
MKKKTNFIDFGKESVSSDRNRMNSVNSNGNGGDSSPRGAGLQLMDRRASMSSKFNNMKAKSKKSLFDIAAKIMPQTIVIKDVINYFNFEIKLYFFYYIIVLLTN